MIGAWCEVGDTPLHADDGYHYFMGEKKPKNQVIKQNLEMCKILGLPDKFAYDEDSPTEEA